jgi:hypothetical protein
MNWSFLDPFRITIEFGIQERGITERFKVETVTVLTEPSSTTTRRCKNFVESEKPIFCFDWSESNMKVKWLATVENIEWFKENSLTESVRWQYIEFEGTDCVAISLESPELWNWWCKLSINSNDSQNFSQVDSQIPSANRNILELLTIARWLVMENWFFWLLWPLKLCIRSATFQHHNSPHQRRERQKELWIVIHFCGFSRAIRKYKVSQK